MIKYKVTAQFQNGKPFYAEIDPNDYQDFLNQAENCTNNGSPLDINTILYEEFNTTQLADLPEITPVQLRCALVHFGIYDVINNFVNSSNDAQLKIWWEYGKVYRANGPLVQAAAQANNITENQIISIWEYAQTVQL